MLFLHAEKYLAKRRTFIISYKASYLTLDILSLSAFKISLKSYCFSKPKSERVSKDKKEPPQMGDRLIQKRLFTILTFTPTENNFQTHLSNAANGSLNTTNK